VRRRRHHLRPAGRGDGQAGGALDALAHPGPGWPAGEGRCVRPADRPRKQWRGVRTVDVLDKITELFATRGHLEYFGEAVSEEEHALQAAHLAERDGADDTLVAAALLHDIGHLLHGLGEDAAERGVDARHEEVGHAWLMRWFG